MTTLNFYKEETGNWYVDLPEWKGTKADLQMVAGADELLDLISNNTDKARVAFATYNFDGAYKLTKDDTMQLDNGALYFSEQLNKTIWLCDVTKFVFGGDMPSNIYYL